MNNSQTNLWANAARGSPGGTVVTDTPPDATGSWGVQFKIDGANIGTLDTASPFTRTTSTVKAGAHTITAVWSKTGAATVTRTAIKTCD